MRVESPFSEKSSIRLILTRARGLGILTINKISITANKAIYYLFAPKSAFFMTEVLLPCSHFSLLASFLQDVFDRLLPKSHVRSLSSTPHPKKEIRQIPTKKHLNIHII